jgi:KUP system potassium uptake protein
MTNETAALSPLRRAVVIGALGVVFGDIGTSPIYTFRECLKSSGNAGNAAVLGQLSLVFWALMIVVTIKYVCFVMRADNDGEGGIVALIGLVSSAAINEGRRRWLVLIGLVGAALFYGDGMITPAISVLSAVEGLEVAAPSLKSYVVPLTIIVLVGLFLMQRRGSAHIGMLFGPIMSLWFVTLALAGSWQITRMPSVFAALDPRYGLGFLFGNGWTSFLALGSVFLALTGAEALYADMGHFGRTPIRLDWFGLVLPALILNYFGQGALVLAHPQAVDNPFYRLFPGWALYPMVILATVATVIASQAVISGAFSLSQQGMQLSLLPRLDVRRTSTEEIGQVYVPQINWLLAVIVIGLVLSFRSSDALAAAYGIAVSGTMLVTTVLLAEITWRRWGWGTPRICAVIGAFLLVDLAFFSANTLKIVAGGWFPLLVGTVVFTLMSTWRRGRQVLLARTSEDNPPLTRFIAELDPARMPRVRGTAVYLATRRDIVPYAMMENLRHNKILHERVVILTVIGERVPSIAETERIETQALGKGIWRMVVRFGFAEQPALPPVLAAHAAEFPIDLAETSFFVGRELPVPSLRPGIAVWRERLYAFMTRNAVSAWQYFQIPPRRVIELGTQVEL